jgi:hypothetical protein
MTSSQLQKAKRLANQILLVTVSFSFLSGCALIGKRVNAYERSTLSKDGMALVQDPKEMALMNHMFNAREGSEGALGGAGGGCGCN